QLGKGPTVKDVPQRHRTLVASIETRCGQGLAVERERQAVTPRFDAYSFAMRLHVPKDYVRVADAKNQRLAVRREAAVSNRKPSTVLQCNIGNLRDLFARLDIDEADNLMITACIFVVDCCKTPIVRKPEGTVLSVNVWAVFIGLMGVERA